MSIHDVTVSVLLKQFAIEDGIGITLNAIPNETVDDVISEILESVITSAIDQQKLNISSAIGALPTGNKGAVNRSIEDESHYAQVQRRIACQEPITKGRQQQGTKQGPNPAGPSVGHGQVTQSGLRDFQNSQIIAGLSRNSTNRP